MRIRLVGNENEGEGKDLDEFTHDEVIFTRIWRYVKTNVIQTTQATLNGRKAAIRAQLQNLIIENVFVAKLLLAFN
jgi:hypothetical protein